jgi:DNA-binding NarL/FixJ family response regulator
MELIKKTIAICETQPVTAEGLKALLKGVSDLEFLASTENLASASELLRNRRPDLIVMDKSLGIQAVLDWVAHTKGGPNSQTEVVVWGVSITEAEALRFLQAGAKGIIRKTADLPTLAACIRAVAAGSSWMADCVFRETSRVDRYSRSELTPRETQVMELVEQGLKNKEIARELGIRPGTVKIHLKHIFEKTGVRGRYGLALSVMREKGLLELAPVS